MKGAKLAPTRPPRFDRKTSSPACFASRNHCEIVIDNKKLIGSAQRRTNKAFLQHGSVLIDCDLKSLNSLFEFNSSEDRTRNLEALIQRTTTCYLSLLNKLLKKPIWRYMNPANSITSLEWVPPALWELYLGLGCSSLMLEIVEPISLRTESCAN